jgi:hypothetical protein
MNIIFFIFTIILGGFNIVSCYYLLFKTFKKRNAFPYSNVAPLWSIVFISCNILYLIISFINSTDNRLCNDYIQIFWR